MVSAGRAGPASGDPKKHGRVDGLRSRLQRELKPASPPRNSSRGTGTRPHSARADLYRNAGDGYTRAFELAVTPALFGAMGYGLDRWLGIVPVLTIVFALVALIGLLLRTWYGYVYRMQEIEKAGPWAK